MLARILVASAVLLISSPGVQARPYYAAKKGRSCVACHVAPAGAGMRKPVPASPIKFSDSVALGANLRAYFSHIEKTKVSNFVLGRSAFYVWAEPQTGFQLVYDFQLNISQTAQAYGIWRSQGDWPFYIRAGRFWLPYGLQWDDPDNATLLHTLPFAPGVGFGMSASQSDTGLELGLAPEKRYFLNVAMTNGQPGGGGDNNESKALTVRAGWIHKIFMLGGTFYRNRTGPASFHLTNTRFGPIAWLHLGPVVGMYEGGFGKDVPNAGGTPVKLKGHILELTIEPVESWLGKLRFESLDPNDKITGDDTYRYVLGLEHLMDWTSIGAQYRFRKETPSVPNDELFIQMYLWF